MIKPTFTKSLLAGLALALALSACAQTQGSNRQSYRQEESEAGSGGR